MGKKRLDMSFLGKFYFCVRQARHAYLHMPLECVKSYQLIDINCFFKLQMCPEVFKSRKLICNGTLRNKHGTVSFFE